MVSLTAVAPVSSHRLGLPAIGYWVPGQLAFDPQAITAGVRHFRETVHIVAGSKEQGLGLGIGGEFVPAYRPDAVPVIGVLPPLYPEWLGDRSFCATHDVRFPYIAGEMANGIATTRMVIEMAKAEMLSFFGAGGLGPARVEQAVEELTSALGQRTNWGVNLIHSPTEAVLEERIAELLLRKGVTRISASAFMGLTPAVLRCAVSGLRLDPSGRIVRKTRVFAKVSRPEVAEKFMSPAPADLLRVLLDRGQITQREAELAARVPVSEDITVEADSGGHTDNRPLGPLLPTIMSLRDKLVAQFAYPTRIRVGAAGGLGTPEAVAAAFAAGAAYVLTGSVNQVSLEAGISSDAKELLAQADIADVVMAPAADMFELGVQLQVLRRGTMFAPRASQLYELYRNYSSLDEIPEEIRARLERDVLHASVDEIWSETASFWQQRDPGELDRARKDPKHRMALVFRWYLGKSSRWAIQGDTSRRTDYQLWCGPAMGSFNRWTKGSFLGDSRNRSVVQIARNLMEGAAVVTRAHQLRSYGVPVPAAAFTFTPGYLA